MKQFDGLYNPDLWRVEAICEPLTGIHIRCFQGEHKPGDVIYIGMKRPNEHDPSDFRQFSRILRLADSAIISRLKRGARRGLDENPKFKGMPFARGHWYEVLED